MSAKRFHKSTRRGGPFLDVDQSVDLSKPQELIHNKRDTRSDLGTLGEQIALSHLLEASYQLEATNWRGRSGELDLIVMHHQVLVIVEVRTTSSSWLERPAEATPWSKRRQVARCAHEYLFSRPSSAPTPLNIRFDICGVMIPQRLIASLLAMPHVRETARSEGERPMVPAGVRVDHVENAYYSPWAF